MNLQGTGLGLLAEVFKPEGSQLLPLCFKGQGRGEGSKVIPQITSLPGATKAAMPYLLLGRASRGARALQMSVEVNKAIATHFRIRYHNSEVGQDGFVSFYSTDVYLPGSGGSNSPGTHLKTTALQDCSIAPAYFCWSEWKVPACQSQGTGQKATHLSELLTWEFCKKELLFTSHFSRCRLVLKTVCSPIPS